MRLLRIWNISLIALSLTGFIGAYFIQDIWLQNKMNFQEIFTHVLIVILTVNIGYKLFFFSKPIFVSSFRFSKNTLLIFHILSIFLYVFTSYILSIHSVIFSGLLIFSNHLVYLRFRQRFILLFGAIILGFSGARFPIIYMLFPLVFLDKNRMSMIVLMSSFIFIVGFSRGEGSIDLVSLGSIFGVEWRDYFLLYDDQLTLSHEGIIQYLMEILVLPIPGHSIFFDTWNIRMGSVPRLLAAELNLSVSGLRVGLINEIQMLFGYKALIVVLLLLGGLIRVIEKSVLTQGITAINISLAFSTLYFLIGQTDVLLTFVYPTLIFTLIARSFSKG